MRVRVGQLGRDLDPVFRGMDEHPAARRLAEGAESFSHLHEVNVELRHRQRLHVGPARRVARALAGQEVVERRGIPNTNDVLGLYELRLDRAGNVIRYARTRMRRRCDFGQ